MNKLDKKTKNISDETLDVHVVWHKFSRWLDKKYGKDLYGEWQYMQIAKGKKIKYRSFDEIALSRRLVGYEVICQIERYVKRYCPEIEIIHCDDSVHAGSIILLVPHPKHGITVMFIPQCTSIQNQFFLYSHDYKAFMSALKRMKYVYKWSI